MCAAASFEYSKADGTITHPAAAAPTSRRIGERVGSENKD